MDTHHAVAEIKLQWLNPFLEIHADASMSEAALNIRAEKVREDIRRLGRDFGSAINYLRAQRTP